MRRILIGKSQKNICSATIVRSIHLDSYEYSISKNSESYWISENFLDMNLAIYAGTREYDRLTKFLDAKAEDRVIAEWINTLLIRKGNINTIIAGIKNQCDEAYRNGRNDVKAEFFNLMRME